MKDYLVLLVVDGNSPANRDVRVREVRVFISAIILEFITASCRR